jgi:hypothetical protein
MSLVSVCRLASHLEVNGLKILVYAAAVLSTVPL